MSHKTSAPPSVNRQLDQAYGMFLGGATLAMAMAALSAAALYSAFNPAEPQQQFWNGAAALVPVPGMLLGLAAASCGWRQKRRIEATLASRPPQSQTARCHHHSCCHRH